MNNRVSWPVLIWRSVWIVPLTVAFAYAVLVYGIMYGPKKAKRLWEEIR